MRILMLLSTSSVTGPAELCLDDARGLARAGHQVLFGLDTRRPGNYAQAVRDAGFEVMDELALCRKSSPLEIARDVLRLRARMKGADLVHCRFAHDHSVALAAGQGLAKKPALVRTAEIARSVRPGLVRSLGFRACDAVIASCEQYAKVLREKHRVAPERVRVLPGRVDAERFSPGDGSALRAELGIAPGQALFGIVSRIKSDRLHEVLVRGFARAASRNPRCQLAIVGRGEHESAIRALVEGLKLGGRVHFAGYRTGEELVRAYRAFDVKIWLAEGNDGTCRAVLEAMACGKPVIVGDSGAMAEIVRHGVDGGVVSRDEEAVAGAIVAMCDPVRAAAMGNSARKRAREFTAERRVRELVKVYEAARARRG